MPTPEQITELKAKVMALVVDSFNGNFQVAFLHYANATGNVSIGGLMAMLSDAGIGNRLTRRAWANGIIQELDTDNDGEISFDEFKAVLN